MIQKQSTVKIDVTFKLRVLLESYVTNICAFINLILGNFKKYLNKPE